MTDLTSIEMFSIGGESISVAQILRYYQLSGKLIPWVRDVVEQHTIFQAIQNQPNIEVSLAEVEQRILDFRIAHQLTDSEAFHAWLTRQSLDFELFEMRVLLDLKLEKLRTEIAAPHLETVFQDQQALLDEVEIAWVTIADEAIAEQLKQSIDAESIAFEQIVQTAAAADPWKISLMKTVVRQGQLPEPLRASVQTAQVGELIGPVAIDGRWCIAQVNQFIPAQLAGALKQQLESRLFQQWVGESVEDLTVAFAPSLTAA